MYRARVQAVSGSKVFADGKWLSCIGNKNVRVGELVYTDGRCVYGHFQESQQPLVITAPATQIIPIVTTDGFFLFVKGKLKPCANDSALIATGSAFINNRYAKSYLIKPIVFLAYDDVYFLGTDYQGKTFSWCQANLHCVLATNISKSGSLFLIKIDGFSLKIIKDDVTVNEINLQDFVEDINNSVPQPPIKTTDYTISYEVQYDASIDMTVCYSFIQDQNNWCVYLAFKVRKVTETYNNIGLIDGPGGSLLPGPFEKDDVLLSTLNTQYINYYLNNNEITWDIGDEISNELQPEAIILDISRKPNPNKKLPLQDGYYFTEEYLIYWYPEEVLSDGSIRRVFLPAIKRSFFSPNNTFLFSGVSTHESQLIAFSRVKGGFLLNFYDVGYARLIMNTDQFKNLFGEHFGFFEGLYFISNNLTQTQLTDSKQSCFNAIFCPLKKKFAWYKNVQEISIE